MRHEGTKGGGAKERRRSFRMDRPRCPACGGEGCGEAEVVRSVGNGLRLAVNVVTVMTLAAALLDLRWRCPGCGARFMAGADGDD